MKIIRLFGLMAMVLCTIAAFQVRAQFFTLYFDENGNGSWSPNPNAGGLSQPDQGQMLPDPTQASHPLVLTYMLPLVPGDTVFSGDIRIWEDPTETILSDVLRFTDANGDLNGTYEADRMIYYSDVEAGEPNDLADTGFPATLFPTDSGGIVEQGVEGNNGFIWEPGGPNNNVYIGISDVPEPASFGLMIVGGLLGLCRLLRWKQS